MRWIFEEFARVKSEEKIVFELNRRNVPTENGRPWNRSKVARLLQNEAFIGNLVYNRHTKKLGTKMVHNPSSLWIRTEDCVEPIIDRDLFFRVREIRKGRRFELPEEEMLVRLRKLWMKKGRLTARIIDDAAGLPCNDCYYRHFGSLRNAYRLIGYTDVRHWEALEAYNRWLALNAKNAAELRDRLAERGVKADVDVPTARVRVNSALTISFAVARWQRPTRNNTKPEWLLRCKAGAPTGWIVALRLRKDNRTVLDHILLRSSFMKGTWLRFMDKTRERRKIESYETFERLARSLLRRLKRGASIRSSGSGSATAMKGRQT